MNWWTDWESNPARVACKASLRPGGRPKESACFRKWCSDVVASRSPALQAGAFTRLAFRAHQCVHAVLMQMVRAPVIETRSSEWHSDARPSSYARMVGNGRNRTSCPKGLRLQRSDGTSLSLLAFPGVGCSGSNRTTYLVGMSHASCQCSTLRRKLRGLNSLACAAVHPCVRRIGGSLTCR